MEDKKWEQSMPPEPYDMRQNVEFAHAIGVAMRNNCPTTEWHSWKNVPQNLKKACNYTLDDTNEELMKLMEEVLKGGYKQWRYDVEWNGGPTKQ
ncbi:unnamed protein product [Malus baccata var. baccata]|uniref:Uncharacterized protein n=1 Tax=Malus baccata TaxID=106549 RepID=A0A540K8E2_MALBA|nr:hypothetical protein C1H46_043958 [Malus baccata]